MASSPVTTHHDIEVADGSTIHWRAAGATDAQLIILFHGYPSSSFQYRELIPLLARKYRALAPDYPNMGLSTAPPRYTYSFDSLSQSIMHWLDALKIESFVAYIFDWGAPVVFNIATQRPQAIRAIISQNGNAYEEGLGPGWAPRKQWWATGDRHYAHFVELLTKSMAGYVKNFYLTGTPPELINRLDPLLWEMDIKINLQGKEQALLDLFFDYRTNVARYPIWQKWLRDHPVPLLAIWGKGDVMFIPPGAEAFKRDVPDTRVVLFDCGHWVLETHLEEAYHEISSFLAGLKCERPLTALRGHC